MHFLRRKMLLDAELAEKGITSVVDFKPELTAPQSPNWIEDRVILPSLGHQTIRIYRVLYII